VQQDSPVVIRKYANRRLYDTRERRYVNLDDIAGLVREGLDVQVVEAKTGEDLTRVVLTQIIVEDAKGRPTGLPLELLRQLIVASDRAGQEFVMWYLQSAFDAYHKVQETLQTRLNDVRAAALSPLHLMKNLLRTGNDGGEEVEQLRLRVAELEAQVKRRRG
jgi:polyhydroxyalkanoate synthesis repressor PhaR